MNYQDMTVGGGLPSLLSPGQFDFAQKSEPVLRYARGGMAGEDMMYEEEQPFDFGLAPAPAPAPAPTPAPPPANTMFTGDAWGENIGYNPFGSDQTIINAPAPDQVFAPAPAPTPAPAPAQPQGQGYWTQGGMQGEDYIEPQWVSTEPVAKPEYDPTDYALSSFNWAKHGWKGGDPGVYSVTEGGGESGNVQTTELLGANPEFSKWIKEQGIQVVNQSRGPNADYYLVKDGKVIDHYHHEPAFIDKAAPLLVAAGLAALNPALAGSLGGGLAGAAGAGAITGGIMGGVGGQGVDFGNIVKGAITGGVGGAASSYLNPAAASAGQSVAQAADSKLLGDIVTGALRGAGSSGVGAALRGDSIADALLSGAVGGGITGGVGSAGASAGLPSYVTSPAGAGLAAIALGRDPEAAAINALLGQMMSGSTPTAKGGDTKVAEAGAEPGLGGGSAAGAVAAVNPADLPAGVADAITQFMQQGQAAGQPTAEDTYNDLFGPVEGATQEPQGPTPEELAGLDTGYRDTGAVDTTVRTTGESGQQYASPEDFYGTQSGMDDWGVESGNLTDQEAAQDALDAITGNRGNLEQDYVVTDTGKILDTSTGQTGIFDETGQWSPDYDIGPLGGSGEDVQRVEVAGRRGEDTLDAALRPFDLNLDSAILDFNKYVDELNQKRQDEIDLSAGLDTLLGGEGKDKGKGGGGGGTTTTTRPKSGMDLTGLLLAMGLLSGGGGGGGAPVPTQEMFNIGRRTLEDIFGKERFT